MTLPVTLPIDLTYAMTKRYDRKNSKRLVNRAKHVRKIPYQLSSFSLL